MYTVETLPDRRDAAVLTLRRDGVGASVHFDPPVHLQAFYREHFPTREKLPVTEALSKSLITLPMFPDMRTEEVDHVLACLEKAFRR
jgi:dTDP-4-amino-4,6-dideoxygalactose transaminase